LAKWRDDEQPYLSFIKRSGRQDEVTRYFRLALGCTEYTDSKRNTDQALKAVDAYCAANDWTPDQRRNARQVTFNYFEEKRALEQPVNLEALSGMLNDAEPQSFIEFIKEKEIPVSDSFEPHRKTYSRFKRISKSFGTVKVSFDVQDVIDEKVDYDEASQSIIINDVPEALIQEIRKAKGDEAAD
jgi:nucleoid-associated protein